MKHLFILALLALAPWQAYGQYQSRGATSAEAQCNAEVAQPKAPASTRRPATPVSQFKCDGRTYCSQMTSCAEATFFLKNCPGVKMDGNNDGVPCERQWCKR